MNWGQLEANKVPQHVQDVLKNPNDYTVHQLLVDFTSTYPVLYGGMLGTNGAHFSRRRLLL